MFFFCICCCCFVSFGSYIISQIASTTNGTFSCRSTQQQKWIFFRVRLCFKTNPNRVLFQLHATAVCQTVVVHLFSVIATHHTPLVSSSSIPCESFTYVKICRTLDVDVSLLLMVREQICISIFFVIFFDFWFFLLAWRRLAAQLVAQFHVFFGLCVVPLVGTNNASGERVLPDVWFREYLRKKIS